MNRAERRRGTKGKDKALKTLGQVAGREYLLQIKEGKEPTAYKLFDGIDKTNRTALRNVGVTDEEIMFVIQESILQADKLGELNTTKASKILKMSLKSMKLMPKFMKINTKEQVRSILEVAVGKEYKNALQEGKELSVEDLLKSQTDKWALRGGGDMLEFYKGVGITEQEVKDAIQGTISYWKDQEKQPTDAVG